MNINDLPQELFELLSKNVCHPHIILINSNCCIHKVESNETRIIHNVSLHIIFTFNKSLIEYYRICNNTMISELIYYNMCNTCVYKNKLNMLKWAKYRQTINKNMFYVNVHSRLYHNTGICIDSLIDSVLRYKRINILIWLMENYCVVINKHIYHRTTHINKKMTTWAHANGITFTQN